jgi:ABC-type bacteriocin/lantibiotic exporter with double-glycine peptidase domain
VRFDGIARKQRHNACAPTSMSSCLAILGIDASPETVARVAGVPLRASYPGLDEAQLMSAARKLGLTCRGLVQTDKRRGMAWARALRAHVRKGYPAVLLVKDFRHWVALCGHVDDHFIVMDGLEDERNYNRWNLTSLLRHAWNSDAADDSEPDQYYALLVRRPDGKVRWRMNEA